MKIFIMLLPLLIFAKTVSVSILPQKYIVNRIAPDIEVNVMVPKGANPATYSPKPSQIKAVKSSTLYFTIGVPFERANLQKLKSINPDMKITDMGRYLKRFPISGHHHEDEEHAHPDPHLWLSPPHLMLLARATLEELTLLNPKRAKEYVKRYENFVKELAALDRDVYSKLLPIKKRAFLVYHPSFGYFAKVYRLRQIAIEKEGKEPSGRYLAKLVKEAKGVKILIIEPQFPKKSARFLAKRIGAKIVVIDPLEYNVTKTISKLAEEIAKYSH